MPTPSPYTRKAPATETTDPTMTHTPNSNRMIGSGYVMFMLGAALSYFLIFPLTFRFLGTYQVSPEVENQIVLESYIGTMMMLNLMMGIVFEIPVLS